MQQWGGKKDVSVVLQKSINYIIDSKKFQLTFWPKITITKTVLQIDEKNLQKCFVLAPIKTTESFSYLKINGLIFLKRTASPTLEDIWTLILMSFPNDSCWEWPCKVKREGVTTSSRHRSDIENNEEKQLELQIDKKIIKELTS